MLAKNKMCTTMFRFLVLIVDSLYSRISIVKCAKGWYTSVKTLAGWCSCNHKTHNQSEALVSVSQEVTETRYFSIKLINSNTILTQKTRLISYNVPETICNSSRTPSTYYSMKPTHRQPCKFALKPETKNKFRQPRRLVHFTNVSV